MRSRIRVVAGVVALLLGVWLLAYHAPLLPLMLAGMLAGQNVRNLLDPLRFGLATGAVLATLGVILLLAKRG